MNLPPPELIAKMADDQDVMERWGTDLMVSRAAGCPLTVRMTLMMVAQELREEADEVESFAGLGPSCHVRRNIADDLEAAAKEEL